MLPQSYSTSLSQPLLIGLLTLFLGALLLVGCSKKVPESNSQVRSFEQLKTMFNNPPSGYRSAPLWVWNDDMTEGEIDTQLADFKEKGIGGVFVHPRPGLITPYISDRWNALFKHTTEKARALGMDVWIYDENSYPSGFAGGHVPAQMPESYNEGVGLIMTTASSFPEKLTKPYAVILRKEKDGYVDVTSDSLKEAGKKGDYLFFEKGYYEKAPWYGGYSYVDILHKGVTEKFLEITMKGYEAVAKEEFGKTVRGSFTDEPQVSFWGGIRWTPDLFSRFQERWGYDLKQHLPSLWSDVGDYQRVRHNYYTVMLDLFIERWAKPYYEYCEKNKLAFTGHYWEHAWPSPTLGPDNMAMYAWHQQPAIDVLMNQYSEKVDAQFGNVRSSKELISAANQMGRPRTLSETYGAAGWALRFEDMKRIADWQYVTGVNFVNQHLSYVTIKGARKRDHPQSFSYHEPWWHLYKYMGDYLGRMSLAISAGDQINKILVLEPTTTAWTSYALQGDHKAFGEFAQAFQDFVTMLEKQQVEYDLGSEKIIEQVGKVEKGKFVVGHRSYDLVVLPAQMDNLNSKTVDLLGSYLKDGGKLLAFCNPPSHVDGLASQTVSQMAHQWTDRWIHADSLFDGKTMGMLSSHDFSVNNVSSIGGILYHHRRQLVDGQVVLLTNTSLDQASSGTLQVKGASALLLNAFDGTVTPYPVTVNGEMASVAFNVPPAGSLLLYIGTKPGPAPAELPQPGELSQVAASGTMTVQRTSPNTLILDYCDLKLPNGKEIKDIYFYPAADTIFKSFGLPGNPWSRAVQYKSDILDKDHFPKGSGFEATFHLSVGKGTDRTGLRAVVERPALWQLVVNGTPVQPIPKEYWLDKDFGVYEIGKHIVQGNNNLTLVASQMTIHSELESIYVLGDFGLEKQAIGWKLVKASSMAPGSWAAQGLPLYPAGVAYTSLYDVEKNADKYVIRLPEWTGTVAEVQVNGKHAGIIGCQPYEADITDAIQSGKNEISVIVYGSLKNLLGPLHNHPSAGAAWPTQFEAGPQHQPPAAEYDGISYGMSGQFQLLRAGKGSGTILAGAPQKK
jgi:hypothetical protein